MTHRILQLISGPGLYGAERMVLELSAHLQAHGHEVHIAALESDAAPALGEAAHRRGLGCTTLPGEMRHPGRLLATLGELVDRLGVQLVHSHSLKADAVQRLATFPDKTRRVSTYHGRYPTSTKLWLLQKVNLPALRLFDHVVAMSPRSLEQLRHGGLSIERTTLIDNGLDLPPSSGRTTPERTRDALGVAPDDMLMVRACRQVKDKGIDLLLRAMARQVSYHQVRLIIAGEGQQKHELQQLARRLDLLDRVTFAGYRQDVPALLRAADLMVISSRDEGLPCSLLEAMALGVPVVAANVGAGIRRLIQPGHSGWLVRREDVDALSLAMTEALSRPDLREAYAAEAKKVYEQNHTRAAMGEQYLELYDRLLG